MDHPATKHGEANYVTRATSDVTAEAQSEHDRIQLTKGDRVNATWLHPEGNDTDYH